MVTCFVGIILFFGGLYGLAKESSLYLSAAGGIVLLIGLVTLVVAARGTTFSWPHPTVIAATVLGVALFAYVSGLSAIGFLLWASVPYLFCTLASCFSPTRVPAITAVTIVLAFDAFVHINVWTSKSSTAAIAYIYSPIWSTLVFAPVALLIAWLVVRRRASEQNLDGVR